MTPRSPSATPRLHWTPPQLARPPNNPNVRFRSLVAVSLGGNGTISRVVNDRGVPANSGTNVAYLVAYP
ncbi:hypothetical protein BS329_30435 [Amycolatopsis coloradensis]|uniref:Uncharacterized protein n=1 Tax=Amycolatopsis coloradensis TaxID=76021 RepID=A0A1R0KKA5_9PSEU|nr:hypothetical protein BS329_30435 [Amycolatopsis coloradensis]